MNNATRVSILFTLLVTLGLVVHASDVPWVIAQGGLPGQLPGQKLPGQLPGPSSPPPNPATAALPKTGAALPADPCCSITAINKTTGIVTAREKKGGRTIEIKATLAQAQNLRVGQDLFANLETRQASLDGKTLCCGLSFAAATPSPAFPATTLSPAPVVPPGGSSPIGSSSSAAGAAPSPKPTPSPTPSGGKDSGPTKPTVAGKGGSRNTDFPNVDTRTINASEGSTAQAMRGVTAASPPTPSVPQSPPTSPPTQSALPAKTTGTALSAQKAPLTSALPGQQRLPVQPVASAPAKAATAPALIASTAPAAAAKTSGGSVPAVQTAPPKPAKWLMKQGGAGRPAILLFHGNGNAGSAWTQPSTAIPVIPGVPGGVFDFRHTPDNQRVGDTHGGPNAGVYKVGHSDSLHVDAKNWWAFLDHQKFTLATWDQDGPGFAQAYASAKVAFANLVYLTQNLNPVPPIALIGHSRGGLLIRKLLKESPALAGTERVRWVITLHSPHRGTDMASAYAHMGAEVVDLMDVMIPASISTPFGNMPITAPIKTELKKVAVELLRPLDKQWMADNNRELGTDGPLVRDLARGEAALPGVKYYTFGGDNPSYFKLYVWVFDPNSIVPQYRVQTQGINTRAEQYFVWHVKAVELSPISPLLDKVRHFAPEITPGKGDGFVTDQSARLAFATHETTHINHMEALWDNSLQLKVLGILSAR